MLLDDLVVGVLQSAERMPAEHRGTPPKLAEDYSVDKTVHKPAKFTKQ